MPKRTHTIKSAAILLLWLMLLGCTTFKAHSEEASAWETIDISNTSLWSFEEPSHINFSTENPPDGSKATATLSAIPSANAHPVASLKIPMIANGETGALCFLIRVSGGQWNLRFGLAGNPAHPGNLRHHAHIFSTAGEEVIKLRSHAGALSKNARDLASLVPDQWYRLWIVSENHPEGDARCVLQLRMEEPEAEAKRFEEDNLATVGGQGILANLAFVFNKEQADSEATLNIRDVRWSTGENFSLP